MRKFMSKYFLIIFIGAVVFFSLWLKEPVQADCESNCYSSDSQQQMKAECDDKTAGGTTGDVSACVTGLINTCVKLCPPVLPKKTTPAVPTTPIIPPVVPSSAESIESCPATPTCPDLASLGVEDKSAFLPDCVYYEGTPSAKCCGCRNVNVLVDLLVVTANWLFGIAGGAALLVFVYGGFVILTAAGGERVKKGRDIIVAAVIGLIIIFTAQVGLKFILSALLTKGQGEVTTSEPATLEGLNIKVIETVPTK